MLDNPKILWYNNYRKRDKENKSQKTFSKKIQKGIDKLKKV